MHVTQWETIYVESGTLYVVFKSGNATHAICMGPHKALEGIEMARRALMSGGDVLPFPVAAPVGH